MEVAAGIAAAPAARLAYVTPSSQYPLGVVLSMARRLELLAWARRAGAFLLEDDYDSEFRYAGRPLASLQGIDDAGRVIYVGTFSKVLFPGLRLGYAVLPPALLEPVRAARLLTDWHPAGLAEGVVTDFLAEGHFAQHLRRMRLRYRAARDALVAALARARAGPRGGAAGTGAEAAGPAAAGDAGRRRPGGGRGAPRGGGAAAQADVPGGAAGAAR